MEPLLFQQNIAIGTRTSRGDHEVLYSPSPDPFSLDLRVIAFSNDIVFAMDVEEGRRRLADIPFKGRIFTYQIPHIETGIWVQVQGTVNFQNPTANSSNIMQVLRNLGYDVSHYQQCSDHKR